MPGGLQLFSVDMIHYSSNISTTSASISSEVPNTEKLMKARRRRRSAFIVSRCLEPLMKYEARVADITSQKKVERRALNSANESQSFTRKYENPVSMSLSGNCFERSKFHRCK